ncbi:hypothetical protein WM40_18685 [Robbsia andropogonis]|uniref:EF-hand domain-containing protein n=1 Tax=Robbsia andropogonis TaxID=28092 RepID=A0A0F5JWU3_9BURK|nr:hypothetical protein [Robbsia andropogonis]KKB62180.1 hypothetical protein WM40_18685 [Robbsia andropogonis]MCP1119449.1 hypothetical protein [Robbsia andropogonis]MCP1129432.1 hypothetical protein [Robbsia andropogonis]
MAYPWQYFRAGGVDQVAIRSGADLAHLRELDQKQWVALACPTRGLEFDARTLDLLDTDNDGRIRPPELIAACEWASAQLRDPDDLIQGGDAITVEQIAEKEEDSAGLIIEAKRILELLGKSPDAPLTLQDVSDRSKLISAMRFNGDGVITPDTAADDETVRTTLEKIIATQGAVKDLSSADGVNLEKSDAFFANAVALRDWHAKNAGDEAIMPFGEGTAAAAEAFDAVRTKIDDFFARCSLAAYDARATDELNPSQDNYKAISTLSLSSSAPEIASLPLAPVQPGRPLPLLGDTVNPAWSNALGTFYRAAFAPQFGQSQTTQPTMTQLQWQTLQNRLAPYRQWSSTRPASSLDSLTIDEITQIANSDTQAAINALIEEDKAIEPHNARIVDLERLLRYKRDLLRLVHNFVSFKDFYRRDGAIFEAGKLYLDSRSCDLTVEVADMNRHAQLAGMAKACLAYCECRRLNQKMNIVSAFTAGSTDFLFVGRNGVFYDRQGNDWDATIVKLIDNPTNVWQAFLSPYKKFIRAIEEQVAKRAAASDAKVQGNLGSLATNIASTNATTAATAADPKAAAINSKIDVGTVAALGVALGSISAVIVGVFGKFVELGWWIPVALIGIIIAISGPSMAIAWLKLRERSLGPILDASGWAINGRMKVNVRLGTMLSQTARIPLSSRPVKDPYADRHTGGYITATLLVLAVVAIVGWRFGWANRWLPAGAHFATVQARVTGATPATPPAR